MVDQSSMPMTIHEIRLHGATNTRRAFLDPLLQPLVADGDGAPATIGEVMGRLQLLSAKLSGLRMDPSERPQEDDANFVEQRSFSPTPKSS